MNYLMTKQAKIVAMTCTHAALKRREFLDLGFKFDNLLMEESAQILEIETFIPMLLQVMRRMSPCTTSLHPLITTYSHCRISLFWVPIWGCNGLIKVLSCPSRHVESALHAGISRSQHPLLLTTFMYQSSVRRSVHCLKG